MRWIAHLCYTLAVVFVSLWPQRYVSTYVAESVQRRDLWIHWICYFGLAIASLWAYGVRSRPYASRLGVLMACILFGSALELLQEAVPGIHRQASWKDATENAAGALAGVLLPVFFWPQDREKRRTAA